jgi:hypothetical protein
MFKITFQPPYSNGAWRTQFFNTLADFRAELQRLVKAHEEHGGKWPDHTSLPHYRV